MSANHSQSLSFSTCRHLLVLGLLGLTLFPRVSLAGQPGCPDAVDLSLNSTHRASVDSAVQRLRLEVAEPGVLVFDLSAPRAFDRGFVDPLRLRPAPSDCEGSIPAETRTLAAGPERLALSIETPGSVAVEVVLEDPNASSLGFKLRNSFVADGELQVLSAPWKQDAPDSCSEIGLATSALDVPDSFDVAYTDGVDPWDCDLLDGRQRTGRVTLATVEGAPLLVSAYAGSGCGQQGPEAQGFLEPKGEPFHALLQAGPWWLALDPGPGSFGLYELHLRSYAVCSTGEQDDHGDTPLCATALTPPAVVEARLANGYGDDEDTFVVSVQQSGRIEVVLESLEVKAELVLRNAMGQVIGEASSDDCQAEGKLRLLRILDAGRYTLTAVSTSNQEGGYRLLVHPLP